MIEKTKRIWSSMSKAVFRTCSFLATLVVVTGCTKSFDYEEEVALSTGKTIVVKRSVKSERFGEPGAGGGKLIEQRLRFTVNDMQIEWADDIPPVAVNLSEGTLFLAAMPHTIGACIQHGSPSPPFVFYRYQDAMWTKIPKELFPDSIGVNLIYFGYGRSVDAGERLTLKRKQEISEGLKPDKQVQTRYLLKASPDRCQH